MEKFANQTTELGLHNKPCIIVVFGDTSAVRRAACNISTGISVYAVIHNCLLLFRDIPTGVVRAMRAKAARKRLLPAEGNNDFIVEWLLSVLKWTARAIKLMYRA